MIPAHYARRCMTAPAFLGFALAAYRDARGLTDAQLAAELGVNMADYWNLCACGPVRAEHRAADLHELATAFGVRADALARAV